MAMLTSDAQVETDRPSRHLAPLRRHFNHKGRHLRHRPRTHHAGEAHPGPDAAPTPTAGAVAHRKRRRTIGITAVGALAITVHLGLGGAALASQWTGVAADVVLAVVGVKVIAVTVIALRRLAARRNRAATIPANTSPPHPSRPSAFGGGDGETSRSEARVPTPKAERYGKQLCAHAAWKAPRAEWTPPEGVIEFPDDMGTCRITAEPDQLVLAIEATGPANLAGIQQRIGGLVERFGSRDGLKVIWTQHQDR
jgi:hypothetical protein